MSSRRIFMLRAIASVASVATVSLMPSARAAAERPLLREDEPEALAFSYTADAKKVDLKKFPDVKSGDRCAKCQVYEDEPDNVGGCPVFPGKLVAGDGWCSAFS
jgi:hypothetical protein